MSTLERVLELLEPILGKADAEVLDDQRVKLEFGYEPESHTVALVNSDQVILTVCQQHSCTRHYFTSDRLDEMLDLF